MADKIVVAMDVYGTLLSTASIATKLAEHFDQDKAKAIATSWRKHQLEYTWRLNSMNQYQSFDKVTRSSLDNALIENDAELDDSAAQQLMQAYDNLDTFPDVEPCLKALESHQTFHPLAFSNGTDAMVSASLHKSSGFSHLSKHIQNIITVEKVECFKPDPKTYYHLAAEVGKETTDMGSMWLVSGNPFDIVGARSVGMKAAWVDRSGAGWPDRMIPGDAGRPTVVLKDLADLPDQILKHR